MMSASTNFQIPGLGKSAAGKLTAAVKRALESRPGKWRVQFLGNSVDDQMWEMCVSGPAVETSEYLDASLGQHDPEHVAAVLKRIAAGE
jgi:hypothetical protein